MQLSLVDRFNIGSVDYKGESVINIRNNEGDWPMQVPESFVTGLGEWIEAYYE